MVMTLLTGLTGCNRGGKTSLKMKEIVLDEHYKWLENSVDVMVDTAKYKKDLSKLGRKYRIGFSNASTSNSWGAMFYDTARWEAEKWADVAEFFYTDASDNPSKQMADCEDLLAKGVDALIIRTCTADCVNPIIDKCAEKGIPVIIANRPVTNMKYVTMVFSDQVGMGVINAQFVVDELGGKGNIVVVEGTPGSGPQIDRWKGAESVLKKYPDIKVLARGATMWSSTEAKALMENWLQSFPKIDGVLSMSGLMNPGIVEALQAAGKDPTKIPIGGDDMNWWMKWIKSKNGRGAGATNPTWCGAAAIVGTLMVLNGKPVPHNWNLGTELVSYKNIDKFVRMDKPDNWYPTFLPEGWKPTK